MRSKLLVEINRLNFEQYQIKFWRERNLVKGGANPGNRHTGKPPIMAGTEIVSRIGQNHMFPQLQEGTR